MGETAGPMGGAQVEDEPEDLIVAVLKVNSLTPNMRKRFLEGLSEVPFRHPWGTIKLAKKTVMYEASFLEKETGIPLPSPDKLFPARLDEVFKGKEKPSADAAVKLAFWCLEHGLTDDCAKVMDKIAETDKSHASVKAYLAVKAALARPLARANTARRWKERLLGDYNISQTDSHHYALLHSRKLEDATPQLDRLEQSFKCYYYWWALRGVVLPVPRERQVAVLTEQRPDFRKLEKNLSASPPVTDSFTGRREGLVVFAGKRGDLMYDKVDKGSQSVWESGWDRKALLSGKSDRGVPKNIPRIAAIRNEMSRGPRFSALLLKALENEWEQTGMSHEVARQQLFASGLLPHNVNAPEWVQFGMGSFFEAPLQSPWQTVGAANPYWLPRFKEYWKKDPKTRKSKYEATPLKTLEKVVTDAYFREKAVIEPIAEEKPDEREARQKKADELQQRKARAASWALMYFLAKPPAVPGDRTHLPGLQRYFKELSKLPRDMELDEKALLACFKRAFGNDLTRLANSWISFINSETLEGGSVHEKIREIYARLRKPPPTTTNTGMTPAGMGKGPGSSRD